MNTQNFNETDIRRDGDGRFASNPAAGESAADLDVSTADPIDLEVTNMPAIERGQRLAAYIEVLNYPRTPKATTTTRLPADLPELEGYRADRVVLRDLIGKDPDAEHAQRRKMVSHEYALTRAASQAHSDTARAYLGAGDPEAAAGFEDRVAASRAAAVIEALEATRLKPPTKVASARSGLVMAAHHLPRSHPSRTELEDEIRHLDGIEEGSVVLFVVDPAWSRHSARCQNAGTSIPSFVGHQAMMVRSAAKTESDPERAKTLGRIADRLDYVSDRDAFYDKDARTPQRLEPLGR